MSSNNANNHPIIYYCWKCGKRCIISEVVHHYETGTGEPVLIYKATCPDRPKWRPSFHSWNDFAGGYSDG